MSQPSPLLPARQRAQALASSGDLAGAIGLLERAVELGKINLTEDDPDVLRTAYLLGQMLQKDDDPVAARRVLEDAYGAGLWRLGDSDSLMLEISHDIGVVAEELGNRHEARKAFSRVAELGPATLGAAHPAVARARAYLGQEAGAPAEEATRPISTPPARPVFQSSGAVAEEEPTTTLPVVAPPADLVQPPNDVNQQVWPAPAQEQAAAPAYRPYEAAPPQPHQTQPHQTQPQPQQRQPQQNWHEPALAWPQQQPPQQWNAPPPTYAQNAQPVQKRSLGIFAAIAAVLAAVIAVSALVFVLANRSSDKGDSDVPTLGGSPPTGVTLQDNGSRIRLTWKDPANGSVSFLVAMAHPGEQLKPVSTLGPGQTSYEIGALNPSLNYCFAVVAVYRNNKFATSQQACTNRPTSTN
ncbi:fibronectin type III domain-containing protein [Paractinoplanes globisporus]|uniref:Fibronectin type III domain-containing protein n=1 Tax=Paractinoplanes globisporus TaxID=113565 RepID=A0ABW6WFJ7_9ACTN|nr:fibronectin type III domain-containing protein [Actinoplanes globisporus]